MTVNVLYIIERMGPGGTEKQLAELIRGLLSASTTVHPHLCTLRPSYSLFDSIACPKIELGTQRLLSLRTAGQLKRLTRFCKDHDIHLVQTFFQDPTLIGAMLKRLRPVKFVGSFRDLGFWRTRAENLKMRLAYTQADGFIANSMAVKAHFATTDKIPPAKIEVIHNGFEKRPETAAGPAIESNGKPIVGIVGNFNRPVKRMGDFIEMAALVKQRCADAAFIIIGDGDQKQSLQQRCAELGLTDAVQFTGRIDDPFAYVRQFTVGLSTSASEGFSNAVIEYMASGVPVVVTDVGGNREMVEHGVNGYRVAVGDIRAMADRVAALIENEPLREHIGRQNQAAVQARYSMERMIRAHETYYLKVMSCHA
ncbi:MAG: glycosyltransferase [Desulfatitalea sp.]